jgi:hypothetical protein
MPLELPPRRPRILLTPLRAIVICTVLYLGTAVAAHVLFVYVELVRGATEPTSEARPWSLAMAAVLGACWLWSAVSIIRARCCRG